MGEIGPVETIDVDSYEDLLDLVIPRLGYAPLPADDPWIYRGVGRSTYELLPSAMRDDGRLEQLSGYVFEAPISEKQQRMHEEQVILRFQRLMNRRGLPWPAGSAPVIGAASTPELLERLASGAGEGVAYPSDDSLPLVALAQHYGIPTRLLDWSQNPLIATFFAASSAFSQSDASRSDRFAVWMMDTTKVMLLAALSPLRVFYPAYSDNPNLAAQSGVFTLWRPSLGNLDEPVDRRPLDELLAQHPEVVISVSSGPVLRKVTVPAGDSTLLLRQLHWMGIDQGTITPGYSGVVEALRQRRRVEDAVKKLP